MCVLCSMLTGNIGMAKIAHDATGRSSKGAEKNKPIEMVIFPADAKRKNIPLEAPTVAGTIQDLADYLREGFAEDFGSSAGKWDMSSRNGTITYNTTGTNNIYDSDGLSAPRANLAQKAFEYYEKIYGFTFVEDTSGSADISFSDSDPLGGAFSWHQIQGGYLQPGQINVDSGWMRGESELNGYTYTTMIHEIGHSLGLGHLGNYNAAPGVFNYWPSAKWANDSKLISAMSTDIPVAKGIFFLNFLLFLVLLFTSRL